MLALVPGPHGEELIIKYFSCRLKKVGVNACSEIKIKMLTDAKF